SWLHWSPSRTPARRRRRNREPRAQYGEHTARLRRHGLLRRGDDRIRRGRLCAGFGKETGSPTACGRYRDVSDLACGTGASGGDRGAGVAAGRAPWANMYEFTLMFTFFLVAVFLGINRKKDIRYIGVGVS